MRKKTIILFLVLGIVILILSLFMLRKNNVLSKSSKIKIIDATYVCDNFKQKFYEDEKYIYYFPCTKKDSIYVKFDNDTKMLVVDALSDGKVTISELISAGLEVYRVEK